MLTKSSDKSTFEVILYSGKNPLHTYSMFYSISAKRVWTEIQKIEIVQCVHFILTKMTYITS